MDNSGWWREEVAPPLFRVPTAAAHAKQEVKILRARPPRVRGQRRPPSPKKKGARVAAEPMWELCLGGCTSNATCYACVCAVWGRTFFQVPLPPPPRRLSGACSRKGWWARACVSNFCGLNRRGAALLLLAALRWAGALHLAAAEAKGYAAGKGGGEGRGRVACAGRCRGWGRCPRQRRGWRRRPQARGGLYR